MPRPKKFSSDLRDKLLLWCDRHCCLCKKACDVFITVHHIDPDGGNNEDNAMPLCLDCHGKVSHYDPEQPIGTKFKPSELKARREQVYHEFTRRLVPSLGYKVCQRGRILPDVGFYITHYGDAPPIMAAVKLDIYVNGTRSNDTLNGRGGRYTGGTRWNLNPKEEVNGHFQICNTACQDDADVRAGVNIVIYDCYDRRHNLLPVTYVYDRSDNEWWLDPIDPVESAKRRVGTTGAALRRTVAAARTRVLKT
jgi:hypothetical protein